jgi:hypothetical protein
MALPKEIYRIPGHVEIVERELYYRVANENYQGLGECPPSAFDRQCVNVCKVRHDLCPVVPNEHGTLLTGSPR